MKYARRLKPLLPETPPPPAVTRLQRWYAILVVIPAGDAVRSYYWAALPMWAQRPWISLLAAVCMFATCVLVWRAQHRLYRRARAAGGRLCPDCTYPLEGDSGVCPECGRPFTLAGLLETWGRS